jgi:hypothetical protein
MVHVGKTPVITDLDVYLWLCLWPVPAQIIGAVWTLARGPWGWSEYDSDQVDVLSRNLQRFQPFPAVGV